MSTHKVLVLGAGMVAKPLIDYLFNMGNVHITQLDVDVEKAKAMIGDNPRGSAGFLDVSSDEGMKELDVLVGKHDLAVSLLPATLHVRVAEVCLKNKKNMLTTSYVSPAMKELDAKVKEAGLVFMNEMGVDPGIDHMSAKRVIDAIQARGGKVMEFKSTTGALPAPECTPNPMGYKFSWAPRGVLLASRNPAHWLEGGEDINVPGSDLFKHYNFDTVPEVGSFEQYPNRDSVPYREIYGLEGVQTLFRGTYRYIGWCETLYCVSQMNWLSLDKVEGVKTYADVTRKLVGAAAGADVEEAVADFLKVARHSAIMKRLKWLDLFSDKELPADVDNTPLDYLNVCTMEKMMLPEKERDMIVMHHEFHAEFPSGEKEHITSTLVDYGVPGEYTSVAKTVALSAAIGTRMILEGRITEPGVRVPITPDVYNPCLEELEKYNVKFTERVHKY